jgi:amino acid transporter
MTSTSGHEPPATGADGKAATIRRSLTAVELAALIFFTTCGGPYGLEPLVGAVGAAWSVVLVLVTPVLWSLPVALMVAELAAMMPAEGGYYIWVRDALGPFWAVQESWWTITSSLAIIASYPILFTGYLGYFLPDLLGPHAPDQALAGLIRHVVEIGVILSVTYVNLRGSSAVGRSATGTAVFVIGAFALMVLYGIFVSGSGTSIVTTLSADLATEHHGVLLLGLSLVVWNFSGWDNASTYAGEVENPRRNYPRALGIALAGLVLSYLVPILVGVGVTTDSSVWSSDAGWPVIARQIGGRAFGGLIAVGGLVSMWSLLNAQMLYVSRVPFVMALDGWFPALFARVSARSGAPSTAILALSVASIAMTFLSFEGLTVIYCLLYTAGLTLEFLALVLLRRKRPDALRPFRVPGGTAGLVLVCGLPAIVATGVLYATLQDWRAYIVPFKIMGVIAALGIAIYVLRLRHFHRAIASATLPGNTRPSVLGEEGTAHH